MSECQTFGSYYDCRSVMHYYPSGDPPDMTPVNSATCDLSGLKDTLRESDIFILKVFENRLRYAIVKSVLLEDVLF